MARLPTFQLSGGYALRGIAATVALGIGGGIVLAILLGLFPFLGFLFFFLMYGLGYGIGEGLSAAVNRRRGRPYQYMAGGAALIASTPIIGVALGSLSVSSLFTLVGVVIAVAVAAGRLRP